MDLTDTARQIAVDYARGLAASNDTEVSPVLIEIDHTMAVAKFVEALARVNLTLKHRHGLPPLLTWGRP